MNLVNVAFFMIINCGYIGEITYPDINGNFVSFVLLSRQMLQFCENIFVEANVEPKRTLVTWNYVTKKNLKVRENKSYYFWPDGTAWDYNNFIEPRNI